MPAPVLASSRRCLLGARNPTWQGDTNRTQPRSRCPKLGATRERGRQPRGMDRSRRTAHAPANRARPRTPTTLAWAGARTVRQRFEADGRSHPLLSGYSKLDAPEDSSSDRSHMRQRNARAAPISRHSQERGRAPHVNYDTTTPAFPLRRGATPADARPWRCNTGSQTSQSTLANLETEFFTNLGEHVARP